MAGILAIGLLVTACGSGSDEADQLLAEVGEPRQRNQSSNAAQAVSTTSIESTTTVESPQDPLRDLAEATTAWDALDHDDQTITPPELLDGVPIAASSALQETTIWSWAGGAWSPVQVIEHRSDPVADIIETYLRDLSGDGEPELLIHYDVRPYTTLEILTPVEGEFVPIDYDETLLDRAIPVPPTWRIDETDILMDINSCSPSCANGATLVVTYQWVDDALTVTDVSCERYRDPSARGDGFLALCDRGPLIRSVQQALNGAEVGRVAIDGFYGLETEAAVLRFQQTYGREPTGALSPSDVSFILDY